MLTSNRTKRRRRKEEVTSLLHNIDCSTASTIPMSTSYLTGESVLESPIVGFGSNNLEQSPRSESNSFSFTSSDNQNDSLNLEQPVFSQKIREWALSHNITHVALKDLLHILTENSNLDVPLDPRTLLETPRVVKTLFISGGEFVYFGIENNLRRLITNFAEIVQPKSTIFIKLFQSFGDNLVTICVGVDGVPLSRSTRSQFWPILGKIDQLKNHSVFVIGLFYGVQKPLNLDFLNDFVNEAIILEKDGLNHLGKKFHFRVSSIIADAPARSFIKGIKNHNSYSGCEKCVQHGEFGKSVIYTELDSASRTDESFRTQLHDDHHKFFTPLSKLKIGLVTQVPYDYMHMCCLGIMRKLLRQWTKGKLPHRMQSKIINQISDRFASFKTFMPRDFQRKPRSLNEVDNFKATEFRTIMLYTGPVALKNILPTEYYNHFLYFHCAMFILLSANADDPEWNALAKRLLVSFVSQSKVVYDVNFMVYNVHGLLHINEDAINFGRLDNISAFDFENFMQQLKKMTRAKTFYLQQVAKRIVENEKCNGLKINLSEKCVDDKTKLLHNGYSLISGEIIIVRRIKLNKCNNIKIVEYDTFINKNPLYEKPINSCVLGIFVLENSIKKSCELNCLEIAHRCIMLPFKDNFVCFPLLHDIK